MTQPDTVHLRGIEVRCIIGINDWEREQKQTVRMDIDLETDIAVAAASENIEDAVNYRTVSKLIQSEIAKSQHLLLEKLVEHVAKLCLKQDKVTAVKVTAWKVGALRGVKDVGITIRRTKSQS